MLAFTTPPMPVSLPATGAGPSTPSAPREQTVPSASQEATPSGSQDQVSLSSHTPAPARDLSSLRIVSVGDSLTQGTQDANNTAPRQHHVYIKQLADHAGIPFNMPDIDGDGIPFSMFTHQSLSGQHLIAQVLKLGLAVAPLGIYTYFIGAPKNVVPTWDAVPGFGQRTPESRNTPEHPQSDFAVCGFQLRHLTGVGKMQDYLKEIHQGLQGVTDTGIEVPLIRATLGNGENAGEGCEIDQAIKQNPDLVVAWAGNNDALSAVFKGHLDDAILTPVEDQQWHYHISNPITSSTKEMVTKYPMPGFRTQMTNTVNKLLQNTQADVMLFNIPNVTSIPLAREVGKPLGKLPFRVLLLDGTDVTSTLETWTIPTHIKGNGVNGRTEFPAGSRVSMGTVLQKIILGGVPNSRQQLQELLDGATRSSGGWLTEDDVLDPEELSTIQDRVNSFNDIIDQQAQANPRVHIVDIHKVLDDALHNGRPLKGAGPAEAIFPTFTGAPDAQGRDGIFSYDGVHPSDTGHAVIANVLLDTIKQDLGNNPKFAGFNNVSYIDEKAVHHQDPHIHVPGRAPGSIILEPNCINEFANRLTF